MVIVGIDPGLDGAIAWKDRQGRVQIHSMPTRTVRRGGREVDSRGLYKLIPDCDCIVVEKLGPDDQFARKSMWTMANNWGRVMAVAELFYVPLLIPRPQEWKDVILRGTDRSKEAAIHHATMTHPGVTLIPPGKRKPSHDWAEALCLMEFGQKEFKR